MNILIRSTLRKQRPPVSAVRAQLSKALAAEGLHDAEVSLLFVGDRAMQTLNRRYRRKDRTTDVLSFAFRDCGGPLVREDILGDIVISLPRAAKQARTAGITLRRELDRLMVHGLLHLLGYDHERGEAEARRMQAREQRLGEVLRS